MTRGKDKLVSLFEPSTEIIGKGKASKPAALGKMVKLQGLPSAAIGHAIQIC